MENMEGMDGVQTVDVGAAGDSSFLLSAAKDLELFFLAGGGMGPIMMGAILIVWAIGLAIAFERMKNIGKTWDVDGPSFMNEIQRYILSNDIQGAIRVCSDSKAALPKVLKSGLKRANQSVDQIQNALDATALEVIPKVERRLGALQVIANLSTLMGLFGTIIGLIGAFNALDVAEPSQRADVLGNGIAKAMYTTALGLMSAITIIALHSWLAGRAEKIVNEIDEFSVKLLDLLGTKNQTEK